MHSFCSVTLLAVSLVIFPGTVSAQLGNIKGRVVLDGPVPNAKALVAALAICGPGNVPDESLVVDPQTRGVANVVVYLRRKPDPTKIPPAKQPDPSAVLIYDQAGCRFIPHVMVVQTGQTVMVVNGDGAVHNTRNAPTKNPGFNFLVQPRDRVGIPVINQTLAETVPMPISCDIHPWMRGYWVMVDHPYAVVSGVDGKFEITDLPEGELEFRVWHERVGYIEKSLKITIEAGETTDIPVIKFKP